LIQGTRIISPGFGIPLLSRDGGEKGEIEFWFGKQPNGDYAVAVCGDCPHTEVHDVMRSDLESLKEQIECILKI